MAITKLNKTFLQGQQLSSAELNAMAEKIDELVEYSNSGGDTSDYQEKLYDGVNIKTINGVPILGSGSINVNNHYFYEEDDMDDIDVDSINEGDIIFGMIALDTTPDVSFSNNVVSVAASFLNNKVSVSSAVLINNKISI